MDKLIELVRLHRMRVGARRIAAMLQMSPNTEREYREAFEKEGLLDGDVEPEALPTLELLKGVLEKHRPSKLPPQQVSSVEPYREQIEDLVRKELEPRAIYDRLGLETPDFQGSYDAVKRLVRQIKGARPLQADDVAIPVTTAAGEVAQVDFGETCKLFDPATKRLRRAWVFVLVLGFSRRMAARITFDQKIETWLKVHAECLDELGGVPAMIVPDNLKAAVVRAAFGTEGVPVLNRSYRELARHYGFQIDPTPPYAPKKKGKVENAVRYVKRNFFAGRGGADADETATALARWVAEVANTRVHGTTRRRPIDLFDQVEREALRPLPKRRFEPSRWNVARVHRDAHINIDGHLYSVPWRLIDRKKVEVRATRTSVEIYSEDVRVATHVRGRAGERTTVDEHLPEVRASFRHRDRGYWETRAAQIGPESAAYVREVFDSDDVLYQIRAAQTIVLTLESVPKERAEAASRRARFYANYTVGSLRRILRQNLDLQPLPTVVMAMTGDLARPRFARSVKELLQQNNHEVIDEPN